MAETSTLNSDNKVEQCEKKEVDSIKKETEVCVKHEQVECVVCVERTHEVSDIYQTHTAASGSSLHQFLNKFTIADLAVTRNCSKYICKNCYELINVLDQAEIEYIKLKDAFEAIISKNPLFEKPCTQPLQLSSIKVEADVVNDFPANLNDSDDEPLASQSKRKRHKVQKKKKKVLSMTSKRNVRSKNLNTSWNCDECDMQGSQGGDVSLAAHKLAVHTISDASAVLHEVKTEDSAEGSQSPLFNNGFGNCVKFEDEDDFDNDSVPDNDEDFITTNIKTVKKTKGILGRPKKSLCLPGLTKKKKAKIVHQCDQCDAKYTSLSRLEQHKQKHDGSKPPYICEVCGAHYKHKRACDIHIALHKGISDWKCDECNKLFPSKNALQRHNNIHTGKLNYQCDLCGKSFIHTSSFKMHKLSHSGVKPHACDVCGLALMTRSHLKRHKRVHSGEKRHECNVCGKRFSERYNLAAHSKSHETSELQQPQLPRRRLFRCNFCPERFERRYMLERHMSAAHGRTLERPPPTPRNTMSKLLKAQAQRRDPPANPPAPDVDAKDDRSSESRATPITPQKLIAQLSSSTSILASSAWAGSYAAEFGLRHEFPH